MERKRLNKAEEADALVKSRRRCALCFGLNKDYSIKRGQVAHLDGNNQNKKPDNLLFLCLTHHDEYDSRTSQSKGVTKKEILHYRDELVGHIATLERENIRGVNDRNLSNEFYLYKISTPDAICGFEYLAADINRRYYLEISKNIIVVQKVYWEVNKWLNTDYVNTNDKIIFPLIEISADLEKYFFENNFSLIFSNDSRDTNSLILTFNESHKYYEIQYSINGDSIIKKIMTSSSTLGEHTEEYSLVKKLVAEVDKFRFDECSKYL